MQDTLDEFLFKRMESKLQDMCQKAYEQGVEDGRKKHSVPELMTRKQFMEFANIGEAKCAELFRRRDFPVIREFGHPRVPTNLLFAWIAENTDWIRFNAPSVRKKLKRVSG